MGMNRETIYSSTTESTFTKTIRQGYCVCRVINLLVCFILAIMLSGCSEKVKSPRPTCAEVEKTFETHFESFSRVAQMISERPGFYEWYYQQYEWHDLREFLFDRIDSTKRRDFFTDSEWQEITALFYEYQLSGIHMDGEGFPIGFYWSTSERNKRNDMISISFLYFPYENAIPAISIPFGSSAATERRYWTRVILP